MFTVITEFKNGGDMITPRATHEQAMWMLSDDYKSDRNVETVRVFPKYHHPRYTVS